MAGQFATALELSESNQLACRGSTYTSETGEEQIISRFKNKRLLLTITDDRADIAYENGTPIRAIKTESHFRARSMGDLGNWQLIHLDHHSLEVSVTTFTSLPDQRHRSVRFRGNCTLEVPVT